MTDRDPDTVPDPEFLSYSSLTLHRKCPQAYVFSYVRHLGPADEGSTIDRDLGSWWHALRSCDALDRGLQLGSLRYVPGEIGIGDAGPKLSLLRNRWDDGAGTLLYQVGANRQQQYRPSVKLVLALARAWWKTLSADLKESWTDRLGGMTLAVHLDAMNQRWCRRWPETAIERPLGVEVKFRRKLDGTDAVLGGYVDEVYEDPHRGLIVVRDHKTNRTLSAEVEDDFMDSQLHLYSWGVDPLVEDWTGQHVTAVAYDRARSMPPKPPQVTQSGTLSKSVTDYDVDTYRVWANGPDGQGVPFPGRRKDGSGAGTYTVDEKIIEKLSTPAALNLWNQRTLTPLNSNVIAAHLEAAADTQQATVDTVHRYNESGHAARNLSRQNCRWCDYAQLCRAELIGGSRGDIEVADYGLRVRPSRA